MQNFGYPLDPFQNEITNSFYGPLINHKDDNFAKNCIKIG